MSNFAELSKVQAGDGENHAFLVRWRGRQEGPYSAKLIEKKLSANEIGLLHEILTNGRWITIRDYVAKQEAALRVMQQAREEQERREREDAERQVQELEAQQRAASLAEEKRRNDLLEATLHAPITMPVPIKPHRGSVVLTYALIGLFIFGPLCLAAWVMGSGDLRQMDAGTMDPSGRSTTSSGRNIGALGTILWMVGFVLVFMH